MKMLIVRLLFAVLQQVVCLRGDVGRINKKQRKIMDAVQKFGEQVEAAFSEISTNVDAVVESNAKVVTAVTGVTKDVTDLKDIITKLNENPPGWTPEDQAILDSGLAKITSLNERLKGVKDAVTANADALAALDAATETPPTPEA